MPRARTQKKEGVHSRLQLSTADPLSQKALIQFTSRMIHQAMLRLKQYEQQVVFFDHPIFLHADCMFWQFLASCALLALS